MKLRRLTIKLVSGVTLCVAAGPLACSNDNSSHAAADGGPDAAQEASTTHPDAKVTPPKPDARTEKDTGAPGKPDATVKPDSGPNGKPDAAPDGAPPPPPKCSAPADPTKAKVCINFDPEPVKFQATPLNPGALDGQGILVVRIFDGPNTATATVIGGLTYPPQPDAGGPAQVSVNALPQLDFDGLPNTVYVFAVFADNLAWFQNPAGLTYGTFVSGLDLSEGLKASLPVKPVTLTKGKGTSLKPFMTAMRHFHSEMELGLPDASTFGGDGQGPLSVGVFQTDAPGGAVVYGTASANCADARKLPAAVDGFFFGSGPLWFAGQIDDFFAASPTNPVPAGALVSLNPATQKIPDSQKITVPDDAYTVTVPALVLSEVLPVDGRPDHSCASPPTP